MSGESGRTGANTAVQGFFSRVEDSVHTFRLSLTLPRNFSEHSSVVEALDSECNKRAGDTASVVPSSSLAGLALSSGRYQVPQNGAASFGGILVGNIAENGISGGQRRSPAALSTAAGFQCRRFSTSVSQMWSLLEDRLIIKLDEARSDLLVGYQLQHQLDPVSFPKELSDDAPLRGRADELKTIATQRLELLRGLPEKDVSAHVEQLREKHRKERCIAEDLGAPSAGETGEGQGSPAIATSDDSGITFDYHSRRLPHDRPVSTRDDDLILECVTREDSSPADVLCSSKLVLPHSPLLADMHQLHGHQSGLKHLILSERDPMWNSIGTMHQIFGIDNVLRFKAWCENPGALQELEVAAEKATAAKQQQDEEWNSFIVGMQLSREQHEQLLNQRTDMHEDIITTQMNAALEADIAALRAVYEAHIDQEVRLMRAKATQERRRMTEFFEREVTFMQAMKDSFMSEGAAESRRSLEEQSKKLLDQFPPTCFPRLLMLADVLVSTDLRTSCVDYVARHFVEHGFVTSPGLSSQLLRANTLQELVTKLTDEHLFLAQRHGRAHPDTGVPLSFVTAEIDRRRQGRLTQLRSMGTEEIQSLSETLARLQYISAKRGSINELDGQGASKTSRSAAGGAGARLKKRGRAVVADRAPTLPSATEVLLRPHSIAASQFSPWRDEVVAVAAERQRRESSTSNVAAIRLSAACAGVGEVDSKRKAFELRSSHRFATVESCGAVRCGESAHKLYFECRVSAADRAHKVSFYIGFAVVPESLPRSTGLPTGMGEDEDVSGKTGLLDGFGSWGPKQVIVGVTSANSDCARGSYSGVSLTDEGVVYTAGVPHDCGIGFEAGDTIGVTLDCLTGSVGFFKNGGLIPPPHHVVVSVPIRICAIVPAVTLFASTPSVRAGQAAPAVLKARVEVNLEGNFVYTPPQGHTSFARHASPTSTFFTR